MVHPDAFLLNDELFQYIFFGNKDQEPRYEKASHHIFGVFFLVLSAGKVGCRVASCEMSLIDARRQRAGRFPQIPAAISSRVL